MDPSIEKCIKEYVTPPEVLAELRPIRTILLTGITGAGKDTIIGDILESSDDFARNVTSTTRQPRENSGVMEQEGVEYYFLSENQAQQKMANGDYIEVAPVHGRINGSLISEFRRISGIGKIALGDINYDGIEKFLSFGMDDLSVYFVMPPNFETWLARLMKRQGGTIGDTDEILRRFRSAQIELDDALNNPEYIPIMNDVSRNTAQKIIEYTQTNSGPSAQERHEAIEGIHDLNTAISSYISQLEEER
jgi:guanylate kinase